MYDKKFCRSLSRSPFNLSQKNYKIVDPCRDLSQVGQHHNGANVWLSRTHSAGPKHDLKVALPGLWNEPIVCCHETRKVSTLVSVQPSSRVFQNLKQVQF